MSNQHHEIVSQLVDVCASIHAGCGVVLIGSVVRGTQRTGSDIDLNIIFPGDDCPVGQHVYIGNDNRWQLVVKDIVCGMRIDVAWETERGLLARLHSDDILNCWPFSQGRVLHDPCNLAAPCLSIAQQWYHSHPEIAQRYESVYMEAKRGPKAYKH